MTKRTKLWIGVPCGVILLLVVAFAAVLLLGPNEKRREVDRIDGECLELVMKVQDRESAERYAGLLKEFFARHEKTLWDNQYNADASENTWDNMLYDYCHNHWAIWFGSDRLRTYIRMVNECNRLYVAKSYDCEELQEVLGEYIQARIYLETMTASSIMKRMFWVPSVEELDRMFE